MQKSISSKQPHNTLYRRRQRKDALAAYTFLAPSLILLLAFTIIPIFMSVFLSFTQYNGFSDPTWVGAQNYLGLLKNHDFKKSLSNTLVYVITTVPLQTLLALILAAILASWFNNKFGQFVRGMSFIPVLCSSALAGSIFYYLFASSGDAVMNTLVSLVGIERQNWLGQRSTALGVICFISIWKNVGYFLVILYAGIMDIPKDYYEAASVDGASRFQQFFSITIPNLRPVLYIVLTLGTIWGFQVFELPYTMTQGGPGDATTTPGLETFKEAFTALRMGSASAMALVLGVLIFVVTIILRKCFNEKAGE